MGEKKEKEDKVPIVIKNAVDLQRLKLEKLMKNPVSCSVNKTYCILALIIT